MKVVDFLFAISWPQEHNRAKEVSDSEMKEPQISTNKDSSNHLIAIPPHNSKLSFLFVCLARAIDNQQGFELDQLGRLLAVVDFFFFESTRRTKDINV